MLYREPDSLKTLLSADSTVSLSGKSLKGFSIFIFRLSDIGGIGNGDVIVALRILLGSSPDTTPTEVSVFDRKFVVAKERQRWLSIILSPHEIATVARVGFISVEIGPTVREKSSPPAVDGLEVYVDNAGTSDSALPFCLSMAREDIWRHRHPFHDMFLFLLKSLRDLKMKALASKASKAEKSLIRKAVEATALSSDLELGGVINSMIASIEGDQRSRFAFQDKAILKACFLFLSRCKNRLDNLHGEKQSAEWIALNPLLRSCFQAASDIARNRPHNFLQIADESSGEIRSIASDASDLTVAPLTDCPTNDSLVTDLVDMLLLELAVVRGSPRGRFGSFDGLRKLLSSPNNRIVGLTCAAISKFCQNNDLFSAQKMAVEYVCDSCFRVIANTRFSVQNNDAVFDLCSDCFSKGQEFAIKQDNQAVNVIVGGRTIGTSPKLSCRTLRSMTKVGKSQKRSEAAVDDSSHGEQLRAAFMDGLCSGLGGLLGQKLSSPGDLSGEQIELCADLIRNGFGTKKGSMNAKSFLSSLIKHALRLTERTSMSVDCLRTTGLLLEGLASAIVKDKHARAFFVGTENEVASCDSISKTTVVSCPIHKTKCRSYVFSGGEAKGRRFYCCESGASCLFFKWRDDGVSQDLLVPSDNLRRHVWEAISNEDPGSGKSVLNQLREFLSDEALKSVEQGTEYPATMNLNDATRKNSLLTSGLLCHLVQFKGDAVVDTLSHVEADSGHDLQYPPPEVLRKAIVQSTMAIISLTAFPDAKLDDPWLYVLSRIALNTEGKISSAATTAIRTMAGKARCRSVLEHFAHVFQFEKLVDSGRPFLQYAIVLARKAAVCNGTEHSGEPDQVDTSSLIGMNHLVSENVAASNGHELYKVLSEVLAAVSKKQQRSWSTFCVLKYIVNEGTSCWLKIAPVRMVFFLLCTCPSQLQGKLLRLLNAATRKENGLQIIGILDFTAGCLIQFIERFVLRGCSGDIRNASAEFVSKILSTLNQDDRYEVFRALSSGAINDVGGIGRRSSDFFSLLQASLRSTRDLPNEDVESAASHAFNCFISQVVSSIAGRQNGDYINIETRTSSSYQKRRFELSMCASCRLQIRSKSKSSDHAKKDKPGLASFMSKPSTDSTKQKNAPEQMTACLRGRLAVNRENTSSDEFSTYIALKHRIAISAVHVEVESNRREVKEINLYYSPRPVEDADKLKSPEYSEKWQLCTTLKLMKSVSQVNVTLPTPVVASNLRIEYAEFSDRSGTTADGKTILSCPRCSGNVTNDHGLCTNCGEVAFQCRKCRHINYDRLDAFLCVECGYCASGNYRFDLSAGYATNAIAITNDEEYDRAKEMLNVAKSCHENLRSALRQKFALLVGMKRKDTQVFDKGSMQLKRAFAGDLPLHFGEVESDDDYSRLSVSDLGKAGTVLQRVATYKSSRDRWPPTGARQEHGFGGANEEGAERTMNRASNDDGEDESTDDIISDLVENGGLGNRYASGLDSGDPLSRLLASVQGRQPRIARRGRRVGPSSGFMASTAEERKAQPTICRVRDVSASVREPNNDGQVGGEGHDDESPPRSRNPKGPSNAKASVEVCDRIYLLLQEAEREVFELEQRCQAWQRLNSGDLGSTDANHNDTFEPSHCSACQPTVALNLLTWWHSLFKKYPEVVPVTKEMIRTMLGEKLGGTSSGAKNLQNRLRDVIADIALLSPKGREIVLDLLRDRMRIFGDSQSAEILGCILERVGAENEISAPFITLAQESLGSFHS